MSASPTVVAPALKRLEVRAARAGDLAAMLNLLAHDEERNPWAGRLPELVRCAAEDPTGEYRACVAERDGEVVGFGMYGVVAGTVGTGILYGVVVGARSRRAGIGVRIIDHVRQDLSTAGARMIVAEVPGDPRIIRYRALLIASGFVEEARIEDYYRDGVAQIIARLNL